jgi:hypothetical protein
MAQACDRGSPPAHGTQSGSLPQRYPSGMTPEEQERYESVARELEPVKRDYQRLEDENAKLRELTRGSGPRPKARKPGIRVID